MNEERRGKREQQPSSILHEQNNEGNSYCLYIEYAHKEEINEVVVYLHLFSQDRFVLFIV